jgi:hypothetical protein
MTILIPCQRRHEARGRYGLDPNRWTLDGACIRSEVAAAFVSANRPF